MPRPKISRNEDWMYEVEGVDEPFHSVTTIIRKTVPKELAWWGMTVGVEGVVELIRQNPNHARLPANVLIPKLTEHKLTVNHTLSRAGERGTAIHDLLEDYGKTGNLPDLQAIDPRYTGYARSLVKWLADNRPEFFKQETMTASLEHGYAGTYDARAILHAGKHEGKLALVDLKTSKQIYKDQHFPQLEAYEQAEVELGESPTDIRLVVQLSDDGKVRQAVSTYDFSDFEVLLRHFQAIQRRKK